MLLINTNERCTHIEINIPENVTTMSECFVSVLAGELCLLGVAELPRADRGLPSEEPLLGSREACLGLHL